LIAIRNKFCIYFSPYIALSAAKAKTKAAPALSSATRRVELVIPLVKLHLETVILKRIGIGTMILSTISSSLHFLCCIQGDTMTSRTFLRTHRRKA